MDGQLGAVTAGRRLSAEADAGALLAGGNAVDAVIAACFAAFGCESPPQWIQATGGDALLAGFDPRTFRV